VSVLVSVQIDKSL